MTNEEMNTALYKKVFAEQEKYREWLLSQPPDEILNHCYEYTVREDIVLALSYSGETDEILKIVPFIHSNGNRLISMTGHPDSALAKNSDVHLDVGVREEACILHLAPTSSTTAQIAMGDALAVSLMQQRGFTSVDFARLHPGGSLGRRLLMTVGNVMRDHDLPVVAPDCSAVEMIHTISKGGLGLIVICDGDRIEGIVTDGDVRRAMERLKADFFNIRAIDIATPHPKTIGADEKLIEASINNFKLYMMHALEDNSSRADMYVQSFIAGTDWADEVAQLDRMEKITKQDVVEWANKYLAENSYVIVFKREGEDKSVQKIARPEDHPDRHEPRPAECLPHRDPAVGGDAHRARLRRLPEGDGAVRRPRRHPRPLQEELN